MRETIISDFFQHLETKTPYAILHHVESVFETETDIDLVVNCTKRTLHKLLKAYCLEHGYYFVFNTIDLGTLRYNIITPNAKAKCVKIELDIIYSNKNIYGLDVKNNLKSRIIKNVKEHKFYNVGNTDEYKYYLSKKALKKEGVKKYLNYFMTLNSKLSLKTVESDYQDALNKIKSIPFLVKYYNTKMRLLFIRINENPSLITCFLGPDGSGKTTIIEGIKKNNPYVNLKYFHLKPIPPKQNQQVSNPHGKPSYSWIVSNLKIIFLVIQYNYNWLKNILPIKYTPTLIIFDRYFHDIIADPKRYRFSGSVRLVKICRYLVPSPNIYFILHSSPEVILLRKKEVSFRELIQQLTRYKTISTYGKAYNLVEVDRPVEVIIDEILLKILNYDK